MADEFAPHHIEMAQSSESSPKNSEGLTSENPDEVMSAEPISYLFPSEKVDPEERPESSSIDQSTNRKSKSLSSSEVEKSLNASFRLLQCQGRDNYILEMHEVETGNVNSYKLTTNENGITVRVLQDKQHIVLSPTVHIISPPVQPRYELSLRERLGRWKVEQRKHKESDRRDKFFIHQGVSRTFRSMQEVATFILYNCHKDDLKNAKAAASEQIPVANDNEPTEMDSMNKEKNEMDSEKDITPNVDEHRASLGEENVLQNVLKEETEKEPNDGKD